VSFVLDKELAFLTIAADVLKLPEIEVNILRKYIVEDNHEFSSKLWERIVCKVGKFKFVDGFGFDNSDKSESKTGSTRVVINHRYYESVVGQITNVTGKIGHIRAAVYNVHKKCIDYFLIPPDFDCNFYTSEKCPQGSIKFSYNRRNDSYANSLEKYRVENLKEVCKPV
jgi:hypothetical protein